MRRLTSDSADARELFPSWSRDGDELVYVRWTDAGLGEIRTVGADGRNGRAVTSQPGHYARPHFSPDGSTIVFEKGEGGYLTAPEYSANPGVYRLAASGGEPVLVSREYSQPHFGAANDRIFMTGSADGAQTLVSTDLNGEAARTHATGELVTSYHVSPNGRHFAFTENYDAFAMPLMPGGQAVSVSGSAGALPVVEVSDSRRGFRPLGQRRGAAALVAWADAFQRRNSRPVPQCSAGRGRGAPRLRAARNRGLAAPHRGRRSPHRRSGDHRGADHHDGGRGRRHH